MSDVTRAPGTIVSDSGFGTTAWTDPSFASADDTSRATSTPIAGDKSEYLFCTNFGFTLNGTLTGLTVSIKRRDPFSDLTVDTRLRLIKAGVVTATDKADTVTVWGNSDETATYTWSAAELASLGITASTLNASDFGVALSCECGDAIGTAEVNYVTITAAVDLGNPSWKQRGYL